MTRDLRLKIAMQIAGFTQQTLAEAADSHESMIARIVSGRARPDRELAERIAKLLSKRPIELGI